MEATYNSVNLHIARKLFKSTIQPSTYILVSLHNLLPPPRIIHLSLDYESPQNFLASLPEPKNTNHSSPMFSPTIRLHWCFIVFILYVFLCLFSTIILFRLWPLLLLSIKDMYLSKPLHVVKLIHFLEHPLC